MDDSIIINTKEIDGDTAVVEIHGEIEVHSSPKIKDALDKSVDDGYFNIIIDLKQVRYIDGTGLSVLIGVNKRLNEKGSCIRLIVTNPQIIEVFTITGLVRIFGIYKNEEKALEAIKALA